MFFNRFQTPLPIVFIILSFDMESIVAFVFLYSISAETTFIMCSKLINLLPRHNGFDRRIQPSLDVNVYITIIFCKRRTRSFHYGNGTDMIDVGRRCFSSYSQSRHWLVVWKGWMQVSLPFFRGTTGSLILSYWQMHVGSNREDVHCKQWIK